MVWINPIPQTEFDIFRRATGAEAWPFPNDPRRFIGFWHSNQGPTVSPMYSRLVLRMTYQVLRSHLLQAYIQLESQDANLATGSTGINVDGQTIDCRLVNYVNPHPVHGDLGIAWEFTYSRTGFADNVHFAFFTPRVSFDVIGVPYNFDWAFSRGPSDLIPWIWTSSFVPGQDTDWSQTNLYNNIYFHAITFGRKIPQNPQLDPY